MAKSKQQELDGVPKRQTIAEITKAAEKFESLRDLWMEKGEPMRDARLKLIDVMKKHGVEKYDEDDLHVELKPGKDSIKVRRSDDDDEEE